MQESGFQQASPVEGSPWFREFGPEQPGPMGVLCEDAVEDAVVGIVPKKPMAGDDGSTSAMQTGSAIGVDVCSPKSSSG